MIERWTWPQFVAYYIEADAMSVRESDAPQSRQYAGRGRERVVTTTRMIDEIRAESARKH